MGNKKSSFQMGNQFNGYGDTIYLKGDIVKIPPIPQDNVTLTPDYSQYALNAIGGNPIVLNPESIDETTNRVIAAMSSLNQVTLIKNSSDGSYAVSFNVSSQGFIANSYSTIKNSTKKKKTEEELQYFAITKRQPLMIREERSSKSANIGEVACGKAFKVFAIKGNINPQPDDDPKNNTKWVKATNGKATGWVSTSLIRRDVPTTLKLADYGLNKRIKVTVIYSDSKKSDFTRSFTPSKNWGVVGKGTYNFACNKVDNKWCVAVGPAIFDKLYPEKGKCEADDIRPFSKFIRVTLKHMKKGNVITEEFCICDIKAHSYNQYPYDESKRDPELLEKKGGAHFKSSTVSKVRIEPGVPYGMIQTGIRFINAENELVVAKIPENDTDNIDFSLIEFCGNSMSDEVRFKEYELISIETNYEDSTRGKLFNKKGKEVKDEEDT